MATKKSARQWVSLQETADHLGITELTVRRMVARGDLPAYRLGNRLLRFDIAEVDARMRRIPTAGDAA